MTNTIGDAYEKVTVYRRNPDGSFAVLAEAPAPKPLLSQGPVAFYVPDVLGDASMANARAKEIAQFPARGVAR